MRAEMIPAEGPHSHEELSEKNSGPMDSRCRVECAGYQGELDKRRNTALQNRAWTIQKCSD